MLYNLHWQLLLCPIKKSIIVLLLLVMGNSVAVAQYLLKGKVTDDKGLAIPFSSIHQKRNNNVVQTDAAGNFVLKISIPDTLVCSAAGYTVAEQLVTKKILNNRSAITIVLQKISLPLSEVIVTAALKPRSKKSTTASVTTITSTYSAGLSLAPTPVYSPAIRIRGVSSIHTSGTPLLHTPKRVAGESCEPLRTKRVAPKGMLDATAHGSITSVEAKPTSLLTAGEVNDFKKWKMWTDYNAVDFKTHSERWQLFPTRRYSVQLQNMQFSAVVGQVIKLVDKINNTTVWTAVTDNTGKAELWSGFDKAITASDLEILIPNEAGAYPAIPFNQGINTIQINRPCVTSNSIQIAFVVDATGSMTDEIDYLKEELGDILKMVTTKDPSLVLQTGAVFYRDHGDAYLTRKQAFTNDITITTQFIRNQSAAGGGDYPEAMDAALETAIDSLEWSAAARSKILFLLMDAPPHDEAKVELAILIVKAAAKGIRVVPVACSGTDKSTEFIMRSIALATNGAYLFLTDDSGIGDTHIKPTTDEIKVELLNTLLQRVIEQMCYQNSCNQKIATVLPYNQYLNPINIKLYPNPTSGSFTIEANTGLKELYIADFTGKILLRIITSQTKERYYLNLSDFPSATYFITYLSNDGKFGAEKIVLLH